MSALPLPLRNRLAELVLAGFDDPEARALLGSVARVCAAAPAGVEPGDVERLRALDWFEPGVHGSVRLRATHRAHREGLADRAGRAAAALSGWRDACGAPLVRTLDRAAALADAGLHFEVHELLEPVWFRAEEPIRIALQGLIQVAVALHHLDHGNVAGARSLLAEGVEKVTAAGSSLPLDVAEWLSGLRPALAALASERPVGAIPRWPRPAPASCEEERL